MTDTTRLEKWITDQKYDYESDLKDELRKKTTFEELDEFDKDEIKSFVRGRAVDLFPEDRQRRGAEIALKNVDTNKYFKEDKLKGFIKIRDLKTGRVKSFEDKEREAEKLVRTKKEKETIKGFIKRGYVRSESGLLKRYRITEETASEIFHEAEQQIAEEQAEQAPLA